jgi:cobalt-zinc-cadmium efflux system membrane fusion protein
VRIALGIRRGKKESLAVAHIPEHGKPLVLPGSTALDPVLVWKLRAPFAPTDVLQIAKRPSRPGDTELALVNPAPWTHAQANASPSVLPSEGTGFRELQFGDRVSKGEALAVLHSVDVANKKRDLIDAILQKKLDEELLRKTEAARHAVAEIALLNAQRKLLGDQVALQGALNTLKTWQIPAEDIQAVLDEADRILKNGGKRDGHDEPQWARVALRAPEDSLVIERNLSLHETIVDNSINLFVLARLERLTVLAQVPEGDLPRLERLPSSERQWTIDLAAGQHLAGPISDIGYLIDPNQHTALVRGYVDNPRAILRAGQFVSATIALPAPPDVVEIPIGAVGDDGRQSFVFVQTDAHNHHYTLRRVLVCERFDTTAFVRSRLGETGQRPTAADGEADLLPLEPLHAGDCVLTTGVMELRSALEDLESNNP